MMVGVNEEADVEYYNNPEEIQQYSNIYCFKGINFIDKFYKYRNINGAILK